MSHALWTLCLELDHTVSKLDRCLAITLQSRYVAWLTWQWMDMCAAILDGHGHTCV